MKTTLMTRKEIRSLKGDDFGKFQVRYVRGEVTLNEMSMLTPAQKKRLERAKKPMVQLQKRMGL